ncbi:hypothetical protein BKA56DRAFT_616441 [Ilyonectria sp. MPI-CAGE-AT-0026]|nr:hypothetical protein BKA56DRAFT_616441 [Ilyonectria sp. MPI-CAGE-AT-0026]
MGTLPILTYRLYYSALNLSNQRTVEIVPGVVGERFYMSAGKPNPNVLLWLVRLRETGETFQSWLFVFNRLLNDAEKGDLSKVEFKFSTIAEALKEMDYIIQVNTSY